MARWDGLAAFGEGSAKEGRGERPGPFFGSSQVTGCIQCDEDVRCQRCKQRDHCQSFHHE